MADNVVRLTVVSNELEAEQVLGLLESEGIESFQRPTDFAAGQLPGVSGIGGPREIVVRREDLERARELLDAPVADNGAEQ